MTPADAPASITYPVVIDGNTMTIDIEFGGTGFWHYVLQKEGTTNVQELTDNLFSFFPNPASSEIQIESDEVIDELIIRDITGRIIMTQLNPTSNETVNVSRLSSGLYLIECHSGNKVSIEKLSIN